MTATIGFKDWALVCEAMGRGRQSIILRKGGLAEGKLGFQFRHEEFFLFPTEYHEQEQKIRPEELSALTIPIRKDGKREDLTNRTREGLIEIQYAFRLEWSRWIDDLEVVRQLAPFHIYTDEVACERFAYDDSRSGAGLTVAMGRVFRLNEPWEFPDSPAFGGCRSWLEKLPSVPATQKLDPVLTDAEHEERLQDIEKCLKDV
jgi:hypothetical protein